MVEPLIRLRNVSKYFQGRCVLRNLNLEIFRGEILVVLGKSGSGKSVLLRQIMGLESSDGGEVIYDPGLLDRSGSLDSGKMGLVFQGGALFDFMSVLDNVSFYLAVHYGKHKISEEEVKERALQVLDWVGLREAAHMAPSRLSGGMRKRVALARSIVYNPEVLLYDEPTAGLDPVTGREIGRLIRKLRDEKSITGIVVTHELDLAVALADRVALHSKGTIVYFADKETFLNSRDVDVAEFLSGYRAGGVL